MGRYRGFGTAGIALGLMLGSTLLSGAMPMAALARTPTLYTIGVDNTGPVGHNFEYVDYFPRDGVRVHAGDVLDFSWNAAALDGAHTTTFLPKGAGLPNGLAAPEPGTDEPGLLFNPAIIFPSDPTCGSRSNPCVYDGTNLVNSGFIPGDQTRQTPPYFSDFFVKLDSKLLQSGDSTDVTYVCEIHPGMVGSVTLVSDAQDATTLDTVQKKAADQLSADTAGAIKAASDANAEAVKLNTGAGSTAPTAIAGTATNFVEVAEMYPSTLTIKAGETVKWVTKTIKDPHTVTFPQGPGSDTVDPLPAFCETWTGDTPPSATGCANPADFEINLVPQPLGSTVMISSPTTVGSSGIIGSPADGFSDQYSFTFPNSGVFDYLCRIHEHMIGTVVAK